MQLNYDVEEFDPDMIAYIDDIFKKRYAEWKIAQDRVLQHWVFGAIACTILSHHHCDFRSLLNFNNPTINVLVYTYVKNTQMQILGLGNETKSFDLRRFELLRKFLKYYKFLGNIRNFLKILEICRNYLFFRNIRIFFAIFFHRRHCALPT